MFGVLFSLLLLFVIYNLYRWFVVRSLVHVPFVSRCWPFIYNLPLLFAVRKNFYEGLTKEALMVGTFCFYAPLLGKPWVFLDKIEDAKYILDNVDVFPKGEIGEHLRIFLGHGIFAADGDMWQMQRKSASHLFKGCGLCFLLCFFF
jgi:hypothetical protein